MFAGYGLVLESTQAFRGLDPRFTEEGDQVDVIAGIVFGFTALLNTVVVVILGLRFFRSDGAGSTLISWHQARSL